MNEHARTLAAVERGIEEGAHVGAQLYASIDGIPAADLAVGLAGPGIPMTNDTLMPWLSSTKAVTAIAVMQCWERGLLTLDDRAAGHLPEFGANGKETVTVRHLLTHTAGFPNTGRGWADICAAPLEEGWVPGQRAGYHAVSAFEVLGRIVAAVTGRDLADVVHEDVMEAADMGDSWLRLDADRYAAYGDRIGVMHDTTDPAAARVATGWDTPAAFSRVAASGSGVGPARELARVYERLLRGGGALLKPPTVEAMTARHRTGLVDETFGQLIDWGLGVMVNSWHYRKRPTSYGYGDHASRRAFGHGGRESSLAFADPERRLAVAVIFNGMPGEPRNHRRTQRVVNALYDDLFGPS